MTILISNLSKSFGNQKVIENLNLQIKTGKISAIIGPNGCGKSTLFNILSGLVKQDSGNFNIGDFDKFKFSYIFQNYRETLLPWRKNYDNLAFPLEIQNYSKEDIKKKIENLLNLIGDGINLNLYPYESSGGQQQILGLLRGLITEPNLILLDEPFSALDYENSLKMMHILQKYYLKHKPTIVIISHDIEEAIYLAEDIFVFSKKPTKLIGKITNNLTYPRKIKDLATKEAMKAKSSLLNVFMRAVK